MAEMDKSPKHGTTNDRPQSESQPDGTGANAPRGETQAQPSGPHGGNPATAGDRNQPVKSQTSEDRQNAINPSAPNDGTSFNAAPDQSTTGTPLNDTFGEAGDPHGRGNLQIPDQTIDSNGKSQQDNFVGNPPTASKPGKEGAGDLHREKAKEDEAA